MTESQALTNDTTLQAVQTASSEVLQRVEAARKLGGLQISDAYVESLKVFLGWCEAKGLDLFDLPTDAMVQYLATLANAGTQAVRGKALRKFAELGLQIGLPTLAKQDFLPRTINPQPAPNTLEAVLRPQRRFRIKKSVGGTVVLTKEFRDEDLQGLTAEEFITKRIQPVHGPWVGEPRAVYTFHILDDRTGVERPGSGREVVCEPDGTPPGAPPAPAPAAPPSPSVPAPAPSAAAIQFEAMVSEYALNLTRQALEQARAHGQPVDPEALMARAREQARTEFLRFYPPTPAPPPPAAPPPPPQFFPPASPPWFNAPPSPPPVAVPQPDLAALVTEAVKAAALAVADVFDKRIGALEARFPTQPAASTSPLGPVRELLQELRGLGLLREQPNVDPVHEQRMLRVEQALDQIAHPREAPADPVETLVAWKEKLEKLGLVPRHGKEDDGGRAVAVIETIADNAVHIADTFAELKRDEHRLKYRAPLPPIQQRPRAGSDPENNTTSRQHQPQPPPPPETRENTLTQEDQELLAKLDMPYRRMVTATDDVGLIDEGLIQILSIAAEGPEQARVMSNALRHKIGEAKDEADMQKVTASALEIMAGDGSKPDPNLVARLAPAIWRHRARLAPPK